MTSLEYSDLWKIKLLLTGKAMERKTYFNSLEPEKKIMESYVMHIEKVSLYLILFAFMLIQHS